MTGKKGFVLRLLSWVHDLLLIEGVYALAAGIGHREGQEAVLFILQGIVLLFPVILTDIMLRRCKSLGLFCLFGAALIWGIKTAAGDMLAAGLTVLICLYRCYVKIRQGEIRRRMRTMPKEAGVQEETGFWEVPTLLDSPRPVHCLLFAAMYLGVVSLRCFGLLFFMLFLIAAELCVCLAYGYLECLSGFMHKNRAVANLPVKAMRRTGWGILGTGMLLLLLFMTPAALYREEPLTELKFELKDAEYGGEVQTGEDEQGTDYMMEELMRIKAAAKETPAWLKAASKAVSALILLWVAYLILRMMISAVQRAMKSFVEDGEDEIIFLGKEADEGGKRGGLMDRRKKERFFSAGRRIRRMYKKALRRRIKEDIRGSETPSELEDKAGLHSDKSPYDTVHELYEKARYGKEECTKEELKQCMHIFTSFDR